ncbi:MAG: SAM-dependent DNA methyltransferase [Rhodospirillales bacterium]|nr:MAG: SAM-dependent DNA methyltransferase [Rhodospirillales bacterium]
MSSERIAETVARLATKPGHEHVRAGIRDLLIEGLGADPKDVDLEKRVPEARGRIDALLGRTVFEFKSDLAKERGDAEEQIDRYLKEREGATRDRYVGLATDGYQYVAFELRDGALVELREFRIAALKRPTDADREAERLLAWLDGAVAIQSSLPADALTFTNELGRESVAYRRVLGDLDRLWREVGTEPEVALKRQLWSRFLAIVYGSAINDDGLWFQHTFLTIVAKCIAHRVVGLEVGDAADMLSGRHFREARIAGAVESDFFDWVLASPAGEALVRKIEGHVLRFRFDDIETDVLKVLYESLIDQEQRHDLGEYYTPDWLAQLVCERAVERPLEQTVLDPACGSGGFLFHGIRRYVAAARAAGVPADRIAEGASARIFGIDIHPVAVIIARVTYLLALGDSIRERRDAVSVPVYLSDAMQWSVVNVMAGREIQVPVPPASDGEPETSLVFPGELCAHTVAFDTTVDLMIQQSEAGATAEGLSAALRRRVPEAEPFLGSLSQTYRVLRRLQDAGRDHIWGYVVRNLGRPLSLSARDGRVDVLVGNPPWLPLRDMSKAMQGRVRGDMAAYDIWVGGKVATHQDLSALFYVKCVDQYLKPGGRIAFVMPRAALTRLQFEKFRAGVWSGPKAAFTEAWDLDGVSPLFPVPSCVLFATRGPPWGGIPSTVEAFEGRLPLRNASLRETDGHLRRRAVEVTALKEVTKDSGGSPYRGAFRQGATLVPRMLCLVERVQAGRLGGSAAAPLVRSRKSNQDKKPWKELPSLQGNVEVEFLRPVLLGESIAPYRTLAPSLGVVPFRRELLSAEAAQREGLTGLADWLRRSEAVWNEHRSSAMSFREQQDYFGKLSAQFPISPLRVVYSKAGTLPAACLINDPTAVIDHKLYWMATDSVQAGRYLCAILNSDEARQRVEHLQSRGQWGARDFDKVIFALDFDRFDVRNATHVALARAADEAEGIAHAVEIADGAPFVRARKAIRDALTEAGVAERIDGLVARLLDGPPRDSRKAKK